MSSNFRLNYLLDEQLKESKETNEDISFVSSYSSGVICLEIEALSNIKLISATFEIDYSFSKGDRFFVNGYQSWTDSFEYSFTEKLRDAKRIFKPLNSMFAFTEYGDSSFTSYSGFHGWDVGYVKGERELFIGNLNARNAFAIIRFNKNDNRLIVESDVNEVILGKGDKFTVFNFIKCDSISEGKKKYCSQYKKPAAKKIFGYTSWYNHYQNINEKKIYDVLDNSIVDFDLFQIDDGFETFVGDWLDIDKVKFPNGLGPIVEKIHAKGMMAGIWLAPFVAETNSKLFFEHPDWFCKTQDNKKAIAGSNWSKFYALNIDNSEVVNYITDFLKFYLELGFDFFKLDFLYAVSLGIHPGKSRTQITEKAYKLLREVLGDKLILGCGGMTSPAAERFDYMRIGPDVSLKFDDQLYMRFMHRERISTKVTLRNTIYRSFFDGKLFLNDPDVVLLRDDNISLSMEQRKALITINALFGSVLMTSDNPSEYDDEKKNLMKEAVYLFKNGIVEKYETINNTIKVWYIIDNQEKSFVYDIQKGIING